MSRTPPASYTAPATNWRLIFKGNDRDQTEFLRKLVVVLRLRNSQCITDGGSHAIITLAAPRNKFALKPFIQRHLQCKAKDFDLEFNGYIDQPACASLQTRYNATVAFDLQTSPDQCYVLGRGLGKEAFGTVFLANRRCDGWPVALKYFRDSTYQARISLEIAFCEMLMAAEPASHHIVRLLDVFRDSANTVLAMEFAGRTMKDAIESGLFRERTGLVAADVISQLAAGLRHIHTNGVIHSDLSYKNVLLDENNHVRYANFGNAFFEHLRPLPSAMHAVTDGSQVTTLFFRAPEILLGGPFGMPSDIWSIGCVVHALLTDELPWRDSCQASLLKKMFIALGSPRENGWSEAQDYPCYSRSCSNHCRRYIGEHVPFEYGDLMDSILALNPDRRLDATAFSAAAARLGVADVETLGDGAAPKIVHRQSGKATPTTIQAESFTHLALRVGFDAQAFLRDGVSVLQNQMLSSDELRWAIVAARRARMTSSGSIDNEFIFLRPGSDSDQRMLFSMLNKYVPFLIALLGRVKLPGSDDSPDQHRNQL